MFGNFVGPWQVLIASTVKGRRWMGSTHTSMVFDVDQVGRKDMDVVADLFISRTSRVYTSPAHVHFRAAPPTSGNASLRSAVP